jgi:hypothetical protein
MYYWIIFNIYIFDFDINVYIQLLDGYSGITCEKPNPCISSPCINGGTCETALDNNSYNCSCTSLYTGTNCEIG